MTTTHSTPAKGQPEEQSVVKRKRLAMFRTIREAAIREFGKNGLSGTSTQALADAAGITKAQFHYYITSKEDLYREVLNYIIAEWSDMFFASATADDPATIIADYLRMKIRHSVEHPDMTRLFSLEMARGGIDLENHWADILGSAGKAIKMIGGWCEAGLIKPVDPVLFLMNMWAVSQYYAEYEVQARGLMGTAEGEPLDAERITQEAIELFLARAGLAG
ncbi:TetR family transcriptional regulator C-terminal domain-containing protein [Oricola sp.]|uniref:TetR family transcriptional regulator C-terminal domain-containing protein n=1 Tax=Oricola sp. TaxID=1979950 RepID=UPI0025D92C55|nr:TetR family transcriptional regulator C-terminal domain-containing protein [Oricola sp.]MCI5078138.1 TetR family transcriptional regulator C-terminal domain-containing protein [Oricola sp.]